MSAILAMTVGCLFAEPKPVMTVQVVTTDDAEAYAATITKINAIFKAHTGIDRVRHVWVGDFAGEYAHAVLLVSQFPSAKAETQAVDSVKSDPDMNDLMAQLKATRHLGPDYLYKAVRIDGMYDDGAAIMTAINCSAEDAYVIAINQMKAILDANGFKDARINLWRIIAGRTTSTHLVVISLPSETRLAELLDTVWDNALLADWNLSTAKIRTTIQNGTYHEITK